MYRKAVDISRPFFCPFYFVYLVIVSTLLIQYFSFAAIPLKDN